MLECETRTGKEESGCQGGREQSESHGERIKQTAEREKRSEKYK